MVRKHSATSGALPDGSLGSSLGASLGAGGGASTAADGDLPSVMTCAPILHSLSLYLLGRSVMYVSVGLQTCTECLPAL